MAFYELSLKCYTKILNTFLGTNFGMEPTNVATLNDPSVSYVRYVFWLN